MAVALSLALAPGMVVAAVDSKLVAVAVVDSRSVEARMESMAVVAVDRMERMVAVVVGHTGHMVVAVVDRMAHMVVARPVAVRMERKTVNHTVLAHRSRMAEKQIPKETKISPSGQHVKWKTSREGTYWSCSSHISHLSCLCI